jgi:sugar phosphate isomerase/epimerase
VVVHPPYRWQHAYRRWLGERLPSLAADTGVRVAVENMFPIRVRGRRVATVHAREAVEDLGTYPNVTLDTSHAAVAGLDPVELARRLGPRLTHVHLSNNAGKGWDSHLPVDDGVLPLDRLLDTLRSSGYAGAISLEIDLRARAEDWEGLRAELDRNRRLCEARLSVSA